MTPCSLVSLSALNANLHPFQLGMRQTSNYLFTDSDHAQHAQSAQRLPSGPNASEIPGASQLTAQPPYHHQTKPSGSVGSLPGDGRQPLSAESVDRGTPGRPIKAITLLRQLGGCDELYHSTW
ncbi:hypothetical protein LY78DRAFT_79068 [Colletotrichum sublineola]|nr:hypothetical protein LY78DRAFT_79068 [Colletotrichum sublineola]